VLTLSEPHQSFRFFDVPAPPVPSLLRGFSAPVRLRGITFDRLKFLALHDTDPFNRWEASQQVATHILLAMVAAYQRGETPSVDPELAAMMRAALAGADDDPSFVAELLTLPGESFLADQLAVVDVDAIHAAREAARAAIGGALGADLRAVHDRLADDGPYRIDGRAIGQRKLRNVALAYLAAGGGESEIARARAQFDAGRNMTDVLAALSVLADADHPARLDALARFYERWRGEDLVVDKWFSLQAMSRLPQTLARVQELSHHPAFDLKNPNRVRALLSAFADGNPVRFHDRSGEGYAFLADRVVALDPLNPLLAARMLQPLGQWRRHDPARRALMRGQLERVLALANVSRNTYEIASKSLA
jgi:aminopeptidase N